MVLCSIHMLGPQLLQHPEQKLPRCMRGMKNARPKTEDKGMPIYKEPETHLSEVALPERDALEVIQTWKDPTR